MSGVSQAEFARQIGKTRQYVSKLVKLGKLPPNDDGSIDPVVGMAVLAEMRDPARKLARRNEQQIDALLDDGLDDQGGDAKSNYNQAAIIHKLAQGKMLQLQLRKEEGALVEKAEVDRQAFDCARIVRDRLMALPQEMAGMLVSMTDEKDIQLFLRNKIRDALMEAVGDVGAGG